MNRYQDSEPTKEDQDENNFMPPPLVMVRQLNVAAQAIRDAQIALIEAAQQQPEPPGLENLNIRQINSGKKSKSTRKRSPGRSPGRKVAKSPTKSKAKKSPTKSKAKRSRR
jgi:hypothetical protein